MEPHQVTFLGLKSHHSLLEYLSMKGSTRHMRICKYNCKSPRDAQTYSLTTYNRMVYYYQMQLSSLKRFYHKQEDTSEYFVSFIRLKGNKILKFKNHK